MNDAAPAPLSLLTDRGSIPLGFVRSGDHLFLVAGQRSARWPIDLLRDGRVRAALPGGEIAVGPVRLVTDPGSRASVLDQFRAKYGPEQFRRWYDAPARVLRVDLGTEDGRTEAVRYREWIESEFDNIANDYDRHIFGNRVNRLLRDRSLARLRTVFAHSPRLLEIGCGSGTETLPLLREGHEITAVDISEQMLDVVRRKAREEGVTERLRCLHLRARDLGELARGEGAADFDGAYSTYGALNCEPDLRPVVAALARLLPPGHRFVAGVYNRWCLFESLGYAVAFQPQRSTGRWWNPIRVGSSRFCVDVYAFSAAEFQRLCAPDFAFESVEGVPVILPPSDLSGYVDRLAGRFDRWAHWDARVGRRWPASVLGDHFLMTLVRQPSR